MKEGNVKTTFWFHVLFSCYLALIAMHRLIHTKVEIADMVDTVVAKDTQKEKVIKFADVA